eukprot:1977113-Prymnesium_polylepis.1
MSGLSSAPHPSVGAIAKKTAPTRSVSNFVEEKVALLDPRSAAALGIRKNCDYDGRGGERGWREEAL